jgi:hypothetical protein
VRLCPGLLMRIRKQRGGVLGRDIEKRPDIPLRLPKIQRALQNWQRGFILTCIGLGDSQIPRLLLQYAHSPATRAKELSNGHET